MFNTIDGDRANSRRLGAPRNIAVSTRQQLFGPDGLIGGAASVNDQNGVRQ